MRRAAWLVPAGLFCAPVLGALWLGAAEGADSEGWRALLADAQFMPALALSAWTGLASVVLSTLLAMLIVTRLHGTPSWRRLGGRLGAMLAVPHAAFAIGLALLVMPSGGIARIVAALAGWDSPPDVATVQDPLGLALIAALVLKELPFVLWSIAAQLQRVGQGAELARQIQLAATMGYGHGSAWMRLVWPQLLPRLALPLLAVWAYAATVVDMALVLGPTTPPTLAVLAWQWLQDGSAAMNRQGAAAALCLAMGVGGVAALAWTAWRLLRPLLMRRWTRGDRPTAHARPRSRVHRFLDVTYLAVVAMLAFVSVATVWTFPAWWPAQWSLQAWGVAWQGGGTVMTTALLAIASTAAGLVLAVAWMESTPARWDLRAAPVVFAPLLVPGLLLVSGLYQLALRVGADASGFGVWLAHAVHVAPYVLVALAPAYRAFDHRYQATAEALGHGRSSFLWRVKWPMLASPIASACAVGFAVSVTQYLSTQFVGAGRVATVTTEALTLASGGQRNVAAAFAVMQAALPALAFVAAWWLGVAQSRRLALAQAA